MTVGIYGGLAVAVISFGVYVFISMKKKGAEQ